MSLRIEAESGAQAQLASLLKRVGYNVVTSKTIRGQSGTDHTFDIYAQKEGSEVTVDILSGKKEVHADSLLAFFAKTYDTQPLRPILVVVPRLSTEARRLNTLYDFETVEAESIEQAVAKLEELLNKPNETRFRLQ